jgi:sec-independent protein translocase protein TatA
MKYQRGFAVPGVAQLAIIAVIAALIFGTKRLRQFGGDVGGMFRGIKDGFREAAAATEELAPEVRQAIDDVKSIHATGRSFTTTPVTETEAEYIRRTGHSFYNRVRPDRNA